MSDDQEKINEQVYERQYLAGHESESFIKEGETSPCPFCLNDISGNDDYEVLIGYSINKDHTSGSTHMEIYHQRCWKQLQREIYEIEKRYQNARQ